MFNFEKLETWRESIAFADQVYSLTRGFPDEERFGLTNQMRRAAVSISSNIAEGCSRSSKADYVRFLEIARVFRFESWGSDDCEAISWAGVNGFAELWEGVMVGMISETF